MLVLGYCSKNYSEENPGTSIEEWSWKFGMFGTEVTKDEPDKSIGKSFIQVGVQSDPTWEELQKLGRIFSKYMENRTFKFMEKNTC